MVALPFAISCVDSPKSKIEETFETQPKSNGSTVNGICYNDQYTPEGNIIRKMDIVIVPDTSSSINDERGAIANGFDIFLNSLPPEVDYRIGVVLGHSPMTSQYGKLYQKGVEPLILDSQSMTTEDVLDGLYAKIQSPQTDNYSDGGEMGMASLLAAINNKDELRSQGFFREDASLAVIFVADEQDICAEFPEGVTPVPDPQGGEVRSKYEFCLDENENYTITPQKVVDAVKDLQGDRPFVIGGVIYNNSQTIPLSGENEIGYGYKETIELAGGISVDLASGEYGDGLARLGKMAQVAVKPENDFNLKTSKVDPSTIEVLVDGASQSFTYKSELNQVSLDFERGPFSVANVKYCEREEKPLEALQVVAGGFHSCAILLNGNVKCWGRNMEGQLGQGHTNDLGAVEPVSSIPELDFGQKVIDLSAGVYHTCAVLEDGGVKCWGQNNYGQLGAGHTGKLGDDELATSISPIPLAAAAVKVFSGTFYNCALLENRKIQCWGENTQGQLGYGDNENRGDNESLVGLPYVPVGSDVVQMDISTVSAHTCAALANGDLKCWGNNNNGQLGLGHTNQINDASLAPIVPFGNTVLQLATGYNHTCALAGGQKVRCWGSNQNGVLGLGHVDIIGDNESADGSPYIDLSGDGSDSFVMVATGNNHSCAIDTSNKAYCWGLGSLGATGHGDTATIGDNETIDKENTLVRIAPEVTQLSGGVNHTCALTKNEGKVICWGQNSYGQLGLGHDFNVGDNEDPEEFVQLQ